MQQGAMIIRSVTVNSDIHTQQAQRIICKIAAGSDKSRKCNYCSINQKAVTRATTLMHNCSHGFSRQQDWAKSSKIEAQSEEFETMFPAASSSE